jgi:hypothetical protein
MEARYDDAPFKGTDWYKLKFALEAISDMIGIQASRLYKVMGSNNPDPAQLKEIEDEMHRLSGELRLCYDKDHNQETINKAYTVYAPQLRAHYLQN